MNRFANITVCKWLTSLYNIIIVIIFTMPYMSHVDDHNHITLNALPEYEDCQREFINACYVDVYM